MNKHYLEISQMLGKHPIREEKESYRIKYINVLEYFVRKYSQDNVWAASVLRLYADKLLNNPSKYQYTLTNLIKQLKYVIAAKFRSFKFFSYRYCLLMDCIFINAFDNKEIGEDILQEISTIYHKKYHTKIQQLFEFLYNPEVIIDFEQIEYLKECWNRNRSFLKTKPIKVIVTANMSAGKSTLLNAFVGKKVNKTQNDACTSKKRG